MFCCIDALTLNASFSTSNLYFVFNSRIRLIPCPHRPKPPKKEIDRTAYEREITLDQFECSLHIYIQYIQYILVDSSLHKTKISNESRRRATSQIIRSSRSEMSTIPIFHKTQAEDRSRCDWIASKQ